MHDHGVGSGLCPTDSFATAQARSDAIEQRIADGHAASIRVLTGDRPTGALHLGHYVGTLANRIRLADAGADVLVVVADYQVVTDRDRVGELSANVREIVLDHLAAGLDPARSTMFAHSAVPALNQLMLPFLSLVTDAELRRNPTVKAEAAATGGRPLSALLLTYPVHQAADILFCNADVVPVGRDQLPHLEVTRTIARRFTERYAGGREVFRQPECMSRMGGWVGCDGSASERDLSGTESPHPCRKGPAFSCSRGRRAGSA